MPSDSELGRLPALEIRRRVRAGEVSPRDVATACLARIRATDGTVRSFVTIDEAMGMAAADEVARRLAAGEDLLLAGVPYALKDLTDTAGLRTTYGSRTREHNVPSRDAAIARRLREAGGILLGKTNTPEFGNRATTAFGLFPATRNPWNPARTAGGSSGGSVAAVQRAGGLLASLGHHVEAARIDLTGLGPHFRVMCEAESAAIDVDSPADFSDAYSRWCWERGAKRSATDYIRATEAMFRRSREIVAATAEWDCLLTPTVTLTPQPLDSFLAVTERVAEDDLAYIPFTYPFNISGQ